MFELKYDGYRQSLAHNETSRVVNLSRDRPATGGAFARSVAIRCASHDRHRPMRGCDGDAVGRCRWEDLAAQQRARPITTLLAMVFRTEADIGPTRARFMEV